MSGGSTGIITRKTILPTSGRAEYDRAQESADHSFPGMHEGVRMTEGSIYKVHPSHPMVKAFSDDGSPIANDRWIALCHAPREIAERFGTLQNGMRVFVFFTGNDGGRAIGFICGEQSEKNMNTPVLPNTLKRGPFRIFAPGIGIG